MLRRIFGPIKEEEIWSIRTNQELCDVYKCSDVLWTIKILNWGGCGKFKGKREMAILARVFKHKSEGRRGIRRPKKQGFYGDREELRKVGVKNWWRGPLER